MEKPDLEITHRSIDFVYDAFATGAIGGSVVALFYLALDAISGHPLHTPSLMGSAIFGGVAPSVTAEVQLNMVYAYTLVHFLSFGVLGALVSIAVHEVELHAHHPVLVLLALFATFELAFVLSFGVFLPSVVAQVGALSVACANLLAAGAVSAFLFATHRPRQWANLRHAVHMD